MESEGDRGMHADTGQSGWEDWVRSRVPKLLMFARQQTRCDSDAEDVLQEALVEAWRKRTSEVPPPDAVVFGLIRRRSIDLARSSDRRRIRELESGGHSDPLWFDPGAEAREQAVFLQRALKELPAGQGEVVMLRVWGGLTFSEVAEVLGIPTNTAASRYRYALEALRRSLGEVFA